MECLKNTKRVMSLKAIHKKPVWISTKHFLPPYASSQYELDSGFQRQMISSLYISIVGMCS